MQMESEVVGLQQAQALAAAKMQLSHEELQRSRQLMEEARRELEGQPANDHAVGVLATVRSMQDLQSYAGWLDVQSTMLRTGTCSSNL